MALDPLEPLIEQLLTVIGEDPAREGLKRTPKRVAQAWRDLTLGYHADTKALVNEAIFHEQANEMIVVTNIDFFSLCEHHLLPFYGQIHIGYIPDGRLIGLSKIPRLVEKFARRVQIQERMNNEIADTLVEILGAKGVGVISEAHHLCMMMRGIAKVNSKTVTSAMRGNFLQHQTRQEFLQFVASGKS